MKAFTGSTRRHRMAVLSIFLVVATLLTSGMNCDDGYTLTIATAGGGSVTVPGEGTWSYNAGTVVELVATPDEDFEFVVWTGDTAAIADPYSASTTITVNGDYSIVAVFVRVDD